MRAAGTIGFLLVFVFVLSMIGTGTQNVSGASTTSPRVIAELGQASTVLIASEFKGSVVVPQPDALLEPTSSSANVQANTT